MSSDGAAAGWLTLEGAARYAGMSADLLRCAIARGELRAYVRPSLRGRSQQVRTAISREDVDEWIRSQPPVAFGAAAWPGRAG